MKRRISVLLAGVLALCALLALPVTAQAKDELKNTDPDKYYIVLDLNNQLVTVYERDDAGEYTRIVRRFICSTGKTSDDLEDAAGNTPTPTGVWKIGGRERFGKFAKFSEYARYWTQLVQDVYFHSVLFSDRDVTKLSGGYSSLGSNVSHGCIRLLVEDAKWLYYYACPGTTVNVSKNEKGDRPLKKALRAARNQFTQREYSKLQAGFFDGPELPNDKAWVTNEAADLRKESKLSGRALAQLTVGEELEVLLYNDAWVKVRTAAGKEGYVFRGYISLTQGKTDTRADATLMKSTAWLFTEKNDDAQYRICKVPTDTTVKVLSIDTANGWHEIQYYGHTGYIQSKFTKVGWGIDEGDGTPTVYSATATPEATLTPEPSASASPAADATASPEAA